MGVLAGYKANEIGLTQALQVLLQFRETVLGHSDREACLKVSQDVCEVIPVEMAC